MHTHSFTTPYLKYNEENMYMLDDVDIKLNNSNTSYYSNNTYYINSNELIKTNSIQYLELNIDYSLLLENTKDIVIRFVTNKDNLDDLTILKIMHTITCHVSGYENDILDDDILNYSDKYIKI